VTFRTLSVVFGRLDAFVAGAVIEGLTFMRQAVRRISDGCWEVLAMGTPSRPSPIPPPSGQPARACEKCGRRDVRVKGEPDLGLALCDQCWFHTPPSGGYKADREDS
jgi:hypothetical protein